ncbi:helix-turn-helix domain-containing protein [Phytopseudomonas dryadis]|uniref:HTH araC/xylS-type domain-containing protein n=1 Tax=Phytopseudomonas dryadis TaxID=2487520 RepID=A0ABY1Z549_9GAMM|nr:MULTISPECIES: helix-turn-helix domain-containing protein [Pseudomonas]TBV02817.1 hypothetical protein DNK34_17845 [Pseudomonas dryadis]TBV15937.1 hypothetical protein DNK41_16930 [Pseudomonas sp. FRB 230]
MPSALDGAEHHAMLSATLPGRADGAPAMSSLQPLGMRAQLSRSSVRRVIILTYPGCFVGEVVKLLEVFASLSPSRSDPLASYQTDVYSICGGVLLSPMCASVKVETLAVLGPAPDVVDTLIVAHGPVQSVVEFPPPLLAWLREVDQRARRVIALGAGAFLLAAADLLTARRVVTHSSLQQALGERYPALQVERDTCFQIDGHYCTSSEQIGARELALRLIREDRGEPQAERRCASPLRSCPGCRSTTASVALLGQPESLAHRLCRWWLQHLDEELHMDRAALELCTSERSLRRQFKHETGFSPYSFLFLLRLEMARQALLDSDLPVDKVARRCGLLDGEQLARMFRKFIRATPRGYRESMRRGLPPEKLHADYARLFDGRARPAWLQEMLLSAEQPGRASPQWVIR